ncbi:MAG: serine hydrolase [Candidatus Paceibacterota bacterium]
MYTEKVKEELSQVIKACGKYLGGARISLSFEDLRGYLGSFSINGNSKGWSASIIKVPIMIEVFNQISQGKLSLEDEIAANHRYTLEFFDPVSMAPDGTPFTVKRLLEYMIIRSDNEASNLLADRVGLENINKTSSRLGARNTMLAHLLAYNVPRLYSDFNTDGSNITTAKDMTRLLSAIYTDKAGNRKNCEHMRKLLEESDSKWLGMFLPKETLIGNKVGLISSPKFGYDIHDVGVINGDYAISIMMNRIKAKSISPQMAIGALSETVYDFYYKKLRGLEK